MTAITERDLIEESIGMEIEEDEQQEEEEEEAAADEEEEEVEETSVGNEAADESGSDHNSFSVNDSD